MTVNKIRINTNLLNNDARSISESVSVIKKSVSDLEESFRVLDSMWDGTASEAFRTEYNSDIEALRVIIKNLEVFNRFENTAREKYDTCEQNVGNIVASIGW